MRSTLNYGQPTKHILLIIHCKKIHLEYDFWRQINHYFLIFVLLLILTSLRGNTVKLLLHRT